MHAVERLIRLEIVFFDLNDLFNLRSIHLFVKQNVDLKCITHVVASASTSRDLHTIVITTPVPIPRARDEDVADVALFDRLCSDRRRFPSLARLTVTYNPTPSKRGDNKAVVIGEMSEWFSYCRRRGILNVESATGYIASIAFGLD